MDKHPFVLMDYHGQEVEIDELMAPLMEYLWAQGISTDYCCQGTPNCIPEELAYISFPFSSELGWFIETFAEALGAEGTIPAYGIILICGSLPEGVKLQGPPVHLGLSAVLEDDGWRLHHAIYFPHECVEILTQMVQLLQEAA